MTVYTHAIECTGFCRAVFKHADTWTLHHCAKSRKSIGHTPSPEASCGLVPTVVFLSAYSHRPTHTLAPARAHRPCSQRLYTSKVHTVHYPGLASFPQKALADAQHLDGMHGSMLGFEVKGGMEAGRQLMNTTQVGTTVLAYIVLCLAVEWGLAFKY